MRTFIKKSLEAKTFSVEEKEALYKLVSELARHDSFNLQKINSPKKAREYLSAALIDNSIEEFGCLYLSNQHDVIKCEILQKGTIDQAAVYPREIMKAVLKNNAKAVILFHNHPSGLSDPSRADIGITRRIMSALELIDVTIIDHLIFAKGEIYSMAEYGTLP